jgi:hypothetical protein
MKHWRDSKGRRWYSSPQMRAARLFRYHVNTRNYNPRGRIHRELCAFCKIDDQLTPSQAHHIDYSRPFVVVWCCQSHHRKIEYGTVEIKKWMIHDYTSLVASVLKPRLSDSMRRFQKQRYARTGTSPF